MIPLDEAWPRLRSTLMPCGRELADLSDAFDRVLAIDIHAPRDIPARNVALVDGFACRGDRLEAGMQIEVAGRLTAGEHWTSFLAEGQCLEVMTGAGLPEEIDRVLPIEEVGRRGADFIEIAGSPGHRTHVGKRGGYARRGALLIPAGVRLRAEELAIAAGCGRLNVSVRKKPRIGVIATGSELIGPPSRPTEARTFPSHSVFLQALVQAEGGQTEWVRTLPDEEITLSKTIERSAPSVDLLLTTGGTGRGSRDLLHRVMDSIGAGCVFRGIGMRPGGTTSLYRVGACPVLALPGGVGGVSLGFEVLVRPAIRWMLGDTRIFPYHLECRAVSSMTKTPAAHRFLESSIRIVDGRICADPIPQLPRSGGLPERRGQGWIELPPGRGVVQPGSLVKFRMKRCGLEAQAA